MAPKKARNLSQDTRFAEVVDQLAGGYKTIGQMVYAVLREAILSGAFAPGEWLRQESLAAAIGVSRIPVRTALLQLESEGLVNFHPHRGARVRTLSPAQINEIYRLRTLLESYALRLSMTKMTPARLQSLRALAGQLDEQPEGGQFLDVRVKFYRELYDAENNPLLVEMIEELRSHVGRYLLSFRFDGQHRNRHLELVNHVESGDLTGAEAWLYSHLESVRAGIQELATDEAGDDETGDDSGDDSGNDGDDGYDDDAVATMTELAFNNDAVLTSALNAGGVSNGRPAEVKAPSRPKAGAAKSKSVKSAGAKAGTNASARRLTKAAASRGSRAGG
jgi:DNA-binding GntR family transcriptional regulator